LSNVHRPLAKIATATTTQLAAARQVYDSAHRFTAKVSDSVNKVGGCLCHDYYTHSSVVLYDCRRLIAYNRVASVIICAQRGWHCMAKITQKIKKTTGEHEKSEKKAASP